MFVSQSDFQNHFSKSQNGRKSIIPWDDIGENGNTNFYFIADSFRTEKQVKGDQRPGIPVRFSKKGIKFRTKRMRNDQTNEWGIMIIRD